MVGFYDGGLLEAGITAPKTAKDFLLSLPQGKISSSQLVLRCVPHTCQGKISGVIPISNTKGRARNSCMLMCVAPTYVAFMYDCNECRHVYCL